MSTKPREGHSALDHPNICTIHEIDETPDGQLFIAMGLYEGETLKQRIARGVLPVEEALDIAIQVAEGLAEAHAAGIVHRDIKPGNTMLTRSGLVKIVDFGIAKLMGVTGPTQTGTTLGTVAYMSPEQVAGDNADQQSDVWSLGAVVYEMLAGRPAFTGEHQWAVMNAIANRSPEAPSSLRADIPPALDRLVMLALEKGRETRCGSAREFIREARACRTASDDATTLSAAQARGAPSWMNPWLVVPALLLVALLAAGGFWSSGRDADARLSVQEAMLQIETHAEDGEWEAAYALAKEVQAVAPDDPAWAELWPRFSWFITIPSDPPGATVFRRAYADQDSDWEELGTTPIEEIHFPFGLSQVRFELDGHRPLLRTLGWTVEGSQGLMTLEGGRQTFTLDTEDSLPEDKVRVPGGNDRVLGVPTTVDDFFLGRFEVTNREYQDFVDARGYGRPDLWEHPFVREGEAIPWEEAVTLLTDATGRPGPSTWEAGNYPDGEGDYPVGGVSWYEAAAYARFVGQELPTVHQWRWAFDRSAASWMVPAANLVADGPAPVGSFQTLSWAGAYDMAGNVREWCFNNAGDLRIILGGGWSDSASHPLDTSYARPPLDRSETNGFRLAITQDRGGAAERMRASLPEQPNRDLAAETPVSDENFELYQRLYAYDPAPLNAEVDVTETTSRWIRERVSFDAAYGDERMVLYLYLPRDAAPPYQTVLYLPGGIAFYLDSIDDYRSMQWDFVLKSGRALAFPVYKGSFERRVLADPALLLSAEAASTSLRRDAAIYLTNDLRRSIDYLETRPDIDRNALGYYGYSVGGNEAPRILALEPRFRAAILYVAGLRAVRAPPEIEPATFLSRVDLPVLMLSGALDHAYDLETSVRPFFERLRTPDEHKRHVVAPGGHFVRRTTLIRESLDWLDTYLGPVN